MKKKSEPELYNGVITFYAESKSAWRNWLTRNHRKEKSVWLILYKKDSGTPSIDMKTAIDQALCFGWIDSKPNKRDDDSYYVFFSKRNPKSNWSRVNKISVEQLIANNEMTESGLAMIELAKQTGTWTALDEIENLTVPDDLQKELSKYKNALTFWNEFPRSVKRGILEWIGTAKKQGTRDKRVQETARLADENIRANQYRQ
jgi:uncharacterized protein YdeI (YjbR/CyaY-like superfamily)